MWYMKIAGVMRKKEQKAAEAGAGVCSGAVHGLPSTVLVYICTRKKRER